MENNPPPPQAPPPAPPPLPPPAPPYMPMGSRPVPPRRGGGWKVAALLLGVLLLFSLLMNFSQMIGNLMPHSTVHSSAGPQLDEMMLEYNHAQDKIVVITIEGIIGSDPLDRSGYNLVDYVRDQFDLAAEDDRVKAVLLKINSPGGEVMASDDIYRIVADFQEETDKPVIAAMGSLAASGGYYVAAPCRWIVANDLTITGSIGVIMNSFNFRSLLDKVGVRPEVYKSGKFKDMLGSWKKESEITDEERQMIQDLVDETFGQFKRVVLEGRKNALSFNKGNKDAQGRPLSADWLEYADGRVLSGKMAYEKGFVDELGHWEDAVDRAKVLAKIANANLVQYQQRFSFGNLFQLFGQSESTQIKVDLGLDTPKLKAGQLYFIAPTLVH